ncbi:MAG: acetoacetate--CoA ligase [Gemmatimonadetes bacterium]|nr:acetoacetate--CoA ligase [Gemmatimonadota bacterium]
MTQPLWTPSPDRIQRSNMRTFMEGPARAHGFEGASSEELWHWSVHDLAGFWRALWDFCGVIGHQGDRAHTEPLELPGTRFFPDARLNYAENLLRRRDDTPAVMFEREDGVARTLTWNELWTATARLAAALRAAGIRPGDHIAAYTPNNPEAIVFMLAGASLGATISTASPDFGPQGVLDRFGQIAPRVLLTADGYRYAGAEYASLERLPEILEGLPTVERVLVVPYLDAAPDLAGVRGAVLYDDFVAGYDADDIEFEALPFDHPLYILFSSGTTGAPKCIVHGAGGVLVQHLKEHQLHADIRAGDRVCYMATCGWMMWNWLVSALASEATILLRDGAPLHPTPTAMFDFAERTEATLFGTSAGFIDAMCNRGAHPRESHDLSALRSVLSTGSPLTPEGFDWVYDNLKSDVHLASVSGGTDLCACFVGGDPTRPVWRGEIQAPALAMAVDVLHEDGSPCPTGRGELVCTAPFPSVPLGLWGDEDGRRFHATYFDHFPGIWRHGDWIERTAHGGFVIHGRSDATLNARGVRIGTAEIYQIVHRLPEIVESVAIGQRWKGDTRIVLFVRLDEGATLDDALEARIRSALREGASPRHVPAHILEVADIPRTRSGKVAELAVRAVVHGEDVENVEALANPEALAGFAGRGELAG